MSRCLRCGQGLKPCLCPLIPHLPTRTKLVILMHPKEFKKEPLGTGKMTRAALPEAEVCMGVDFSDDRRVNELLADSAFYPVLLWPGEGALPWEGPEGLPARCEGRRLAVFLLDATWPCARKMFRLNPNLQAMPRLALEPTGLSEFLIKQQPDSRCLSTVEAARLLFQTLERHGMEETRDWESLLAPFREMNRRQIEIASDPNRQGYRRERGYDVEGIRARALEGTRSRKLF